MEVRVGAGDSMCRQEVQFIVGGVTSYYVEVIVGGGQSRQRSQKVEVRSILKILYILAVVIGGVITYNGHQR